MNTPLLKPVVRFSEQAKTLDASLPLKHKLVVLAVAASPVSILLHALLPNQGVWLWLGSLGIVALVSALAAFLVYRALAPLDHLAQRLRELAQTQGNIETRLNLQGSGEVVSMAHDFDRIMDRVQGVIDPLREQTYPLTCAANELEKVSSTLEIGVRVMESSAQNARQVSSKTSNDLAGVSGSLQDISGCVSMLTDSLTSVNAALGLISDSCREEVGLAEQARNEVASSGLAMTTLSQEAEAIGGILTVIQEIAGHTRLLALNATIEAARAGEQGKGFAVVASEIKELAGQTTQATERIHSMIGRIRAAVVNAESSMQGVAQRVDVVEQVSRRIEEAVGQQKGSLDEVAANVRFVDEQAASVSQIVTEAGFELSGMTQIIQELEIPLTEIRTKAELVAEDAKNLKILGQNLGALLDDFAPQTSSVHS